MLSQIELTNFKCFARLKLACTSLNLLCGLNGMGKSSFFQALLVLQQSFETGELSRGRLVLGGDRIDVGTHSDVIFEDAKSYFVGFTLQSEATYNKWKMPFALSEEQLVVPMGNFGGNMGDVPSEWRIELPYVSPRVGIRRPNYIPPEWRIIPPFGGRTVYVNAERIGPRKSYPHSEILARNGDFGARGEFSWNYLFLNQNQLLEQDDPRCLERKERRLIDVVNQWLQVICPGAILRLQTVVSADAVIAGFSFDRVAGDVSDWFRPTNVGFGLSYALPVILALLSSPRTLCLIENPEAHLHPRGQTKLAELAALAADFGVQVFVETHSDHFMDGVRIAVREGLIRPEATSLHYFERQDDRAIVTSPKVDGDGRLSRWPAGFFDQHRENLSRLLGPRF